MTKWFGNFLFSENRNEYIRIAFEYNSTPWRVYNLAHRSKARSRKEERILMHVIWTKTHRKELQTKLRETS